MGDPRVTVHSPACGWGLQATAIGLVLKQLPRRPHVAASSDQLVWLVYKRENVG